MGADRAGGAWLATHWFLREAGVWYDRNTEEVRAAQRDADYAYRLAVDAPASKELRLFGLADWTIGRFVARRTRLHDLQYAATRLREQPMLWSVVLVVVANVVVFWSLASAAADGRLTLGQVVAFVQSAVGVSMIAFGGLSWALDGAAAPVAAVLRLEPAMRTAGALASGDRKAAGTPAREIRFRDLSFGYPGGPLVLDHFDLSIPAGSSLAIVGQNGAGKTTLAKLLCRLYDPRAGAIEIDGVDVRALDLASWRSRVTAVFQDFIRLELPLRDNVAPGGAPDEAITRSTCGPRVRRTSRRSTPCSPAATRAAPTCQADNGSASPSRERCAPSRSARASCCWTNRPPSWTCGARRRSSIACSPRRGTARRF